FDSDNSSGEFSEAVHKVDVDDHQSHRTGKHNGDGPVQENGIKKHRTSLPAPMFTRSDFSVWSILKKCIGLELSKITMPIAFNEPLSFLQRITEYMEHTYLINKANCHSNPLERMQAVAAFAVSAVAAQWERTGKPFNPLLGETYELISKKKLSVIYGKWTECLWCVDPYSYENYKKNERKGGDQKKPKPREDPENDEADDMPEIQETVQVIPGSKLLWRISSRPSNSSQMYNFTSFAVTLNELEKGMEDILAPTDCRLRPDIRHMENGEI
ncbi:oxysterol-binding protein-related protein 2, partial [Protobothrops mucrosquamatus]|uniref:oxysterol-binding protein-related protein 2 n=1 Tax=Protobothrops mucrosquamatus TaxID=103944 RepID=UPI000775959C